ncbi:MAG: hypothetical protein ACK480_15070, partial [Planctomycetota bacterium]
MIATPRFDKSLITKVRRADAMAMRQQGIGKLRALGCSAWTLCVLAIFSMSLKAQDVKGIVIE